LPLPSCFLASTSADFDFGDDNGLCRPAAVAVELAATVSPLPLPSGFFASAFLTSSVFDFAVGDGLRRPAAIAVELAPTVSPLALASLPLPSGFLPSAAEPFGLSTGNSMDLLLPLPSRLSFS